MTPPLPLTATLCALLAAVALSAGIATTAVVDDSEAGAWFAVLRAGEARSGHLAPGGGRSHGAYGPLLVRSAAAEMPMTDVLAQWARVGAYETAHAPLRVWVVRVAATVTATNVTRFFATSPPVSGQTGDTGTGCVAPSPV